jgi:hypothetical protein
MWTSPSITKAVRAVDRDRTIRTNMVLHIIYVEGRSGHGHPQTVLLQNQDRLVKTNLFQVVHRQLTAGQLHHNVL